MENYIEIKCQVKGSKHLTGPNLNDPVMDVQFTSTCSSLPASKLENFFCFILDKKYKFKERFKESLKEDKVVWVVLLMNNYYSVLGHAVIMDDHKTAYTFKVYYNDGWEEVLDKGFNEAFDYLYNEGKRLEEKFDQELDKLIEEDK